MGGKISENKILTPKSTKLNRNFWVGGGHL
jgi:hypothetical protein